jgi:O-succinylhomoserine sulfhydrylase
MRAAFADEIDRNIYSRFTNPNVAELSEKIRILEGAEAGHSTATGMAAVFATFGALLSAGDHILACRSLFGSTHTILTKILPRWGITHSYFDAWDPDSWAAGVRTTPSSSSPRRPRTRRSTWSTSSGSWRSAASTT